MRQWKPSVELTKKEQFILKRLRRTRKLFAFLRLHRHELFDDRFQEELAGMYRGTGAGEEPVPPALLCMALLLQGYHRISDAEAVELTMMDLRWQMVLDCVGADEPAFAQGTLQAFRERLIAADLDERGDLPEGGHSAALVVEHQGWARYQLEQSGAEGRGNREARRASDLAQ